MKREWRKIVAAAAGSVAVVALAGLARAQQGAAPAQQDWTDQAKNPVSWFKWGADERIRQEYIYNPFFFDTTPPGHTWNFDRFRTRVWGTVSPCQEFDFNIRLTNEIRYWWTPSSKPDPASGNSDGPWDWSDVVFDNLNFKVKDFVGDKAVLGSTATVGRQDIILGDGWLVLEGTPLDGSRTIYFDAVRFTLDLKNAKTAVDVIGLQQPADPDVWAAAINSRSYPFTNEQDQTGAIVYVTNKSLEKTQVDGYFIYKHSNEERQELIEAGMSPNSDQGDVYTFGSRLVHKFNPNWTGRIEGAYEFGTRNNPVMFGAQGNDLSAWGMTSRLTYAFNDDWKNQLYVGLELLSGDDPDDSTNTQFDPLWGRWPQWSELFVYPFATETRIAEMTNLIRPNIGWQANPSAKLSLTATYQPLWAFDNTREEQGVIGFGTGDFRGQLITGVVRYRFNSHFSAGFVGEYFFTGDFYEAAGPRNDEDIAYVRGELVFTF